MELAELKKEPAYLARAFENAEKNKSVLLTEMTKSNKTRYLGNLPDSLAQREMRLQKERDILTKKQLNAKIDSVRAELLAKENELNYEINELLQIIKNDYPKYHNLQYGSQQIDVQAIQDKLDAQTLFLEYFVADSMVYLFRID